MIVTAFSASNHFLRKPVFRQGEKTGPETWARIPGPFLVPSSIGTLSERRFSQKMVASSVAVTITIFGAQKTTLVFA